MLYKVSVYTQEGLQHDVPSLVPPYSKNWPDTRPAVMIIRGPRPTNSPRKPASFARTARRYIMEPVGP